MGRRHTVAIALAFACAAGFATGAVPDSDDPRRHSPGRGALPLPSQAPGDLASGRLLVASRKLVNPIFGQSVILLLEHGETGAMGVIVNRPTESPLSELLPGFEALGRRSDRAWFGGPVGLRSAFLLLIQSQSPPEGAREIIEGVHASGEPDALRALLADEDSAFRGYVGYAGWGPSQLEGEMARRDWWVMRGDAATAFTDDPAGLWSELIAQCEGVQARHGAEP
ncbi:MAG: YqgE/AlgH family protein [Myxococcota bacterium]|nr:YqgE/AlgH family protein [Myxococcota bacterium]